MRDDKVKKYTLKEIGDEGCQALSYARILAIYRTPENRRTLADAQMIAEYAEAAEMGKQLYGEREMHNRRERGMKRLLEMGIIEAKRNGQGELEPTVIHNDRIDGGSVLITEAFQ